MGKRAPITFQPRLLGAPEAAAYLGISASKLATIRLPRKILGGRKLYDRLDLDAYASSLPTEGDEDDGVDSCAGKFGRTR